VALHRLLLGEVEGCRGTDVLHIGSEADGVSAGSSLCCEKTIKNPLILTVVCFFV
jgi:hypothetical protein